MLFQPKTKDLLPSLQSVCSQSAGDSDSRSARPWSVVLPGGIGVTGPGISNVFEIKVCIYFY